MLGRIAEPMTHHWGLLRTDSAGCLIRQAAAHRTACKKTGNEEDTRTTTVAPRASDAPEVIKPKSKQGDRLSRAAQLREAGDFHARGLLDMTIQLNKKDAKIAELQQEMKTMRAKLAQRSRTLLLTAPAGISLDAVFGTTPPPPPSRIWSATSSRFHALGLLELVEAQEYPAFKQDDSFLEESPYEWHELQSARALRPVMWDFIVENNVKLFDCVVNISGYDMGFEDAAQILESLHWVLFRNLDALTNLQAEDSTAIVVGVPFPLDQQEAELLAAISDDYFGIDVKVVPYTEEQYAVDCAWRAERAILANNHDCVPQDC